MSWSRPFDSRNVHTLVDLARRRPEEFSRRNRGWTFAMACADAGDSAAPCLKRVLEALAPCHARLDATGICFDVNSAGGVTSTEKCALRMAVRHNHWRIASILLCHGATSTRQCLFEAASYGRTSLIRLLITYGANVSAASSYGFTAAHVAARDGQHRALKTLIDRKVPDVLDKGGESALTIAVTRRDLAAAVILLSHGYIGGGLQAALKLAVERRYGDFAHILVAYGAKAESTDPNDFAHRLCCIGRAENLILALREGLPMKYFKIAFCDLVKRDGEGARVRQDYLDDVLEDSPQADSEYLPDVLESEKQEIYSLLRTLTWSMDHHKNFTPRFRSSILHVLLANSRESALPHLPVEIMHLIFRWM